MFGSMHNVFTFALPKQLRRGIKQTKMKLTAAQEKRISELTHAMEIESANNFPNGDLWNKMSDTIFCIKTYGQEKPLTDILDSDGIVIGQKYENGTELYFEVMTFDNSYN